MIRETAARIEQDATLWLMRLDREGRTSELIAELDAWLAGDPRRRGAWLQAEAAWLLLDELSPETASERGDLSRKTSGPARAREVANDDDGPADDLRFTTGELSRRKLLLGGGATALAASIVGGFLLLPRRELYATEVGEIRRVPLADGSTAAINTQSEVAIAFAARRRIIELERGEAFFQVSRDQARPFLVEAGRIRVMAVGTAFSVRRRDNGADVLVTEGIVEAWADGAEGARVRLTAGERAFIADNAAVTRTLNSAGDVDRALAWRSGRIDLAGETLEHAAAEFNRYNRRPIVIADPHIASERFYGVFRTDDPEGFALSVNESLNVPVHAGPTEIRIGRPVS